ncbi:MAG: acetoacetate--CoA ligase [Pseudomonadota bacterium]
MTTDAPTPLWTPTPERMQNTRMARFIDWLAGQHAPEVVDYPSLYQYSIEQPARFWTAFWRFADIIGDPGEPFSTGWPAMPGTRLFPDGTLNFAENLLRFDDDRIAIEFVNERGERRKLSHQGLRQEVARVAQGLIELNVQPGDRVAAYMPNLPETVIAMLATASIGAIWTSCSPDFGVRGVLDRFGQIRPKVLFAATGYCYNGKSFDCLQRIEALRPALPSVEATVLVPYINDLPDTVLDDATHAWTAFGASTNTDPALVFEPLPFNHPLYILYSSGTTGKPKCIVHGAGGTLLQHQKELILHTDLRRDDGLFYFTTCGWMMWNWLVSGLAVGARLILYDGSPFYPDGQALWALIDELEIAIFGTSAKWISACEKAGIRPAADYRLDSLRVLLSTGSPLLPESFEYVYRDVKADLQLSSISGGTDIVSCFALGNPLLPVYTGQLQCRGLGMRVEIRNEHGVVVEHELGELTCAMPFPSMPVEFWDDPGDQRYRAAYFEQFPGVWCQGDYAELTPQGGLKIVGRSDATLNPGGVRIGTAEIYRQVDKLDDILESLCVGQQWQGDERVVLFVCLRDGVMLDDALQQRIRSAIRSQTTPRHVPARIVQVNALPRTVSGKITELAVRDVIHGRPVKNTTALANPEALEQFRNLEALAS